MAETSAASSVRSLVRSLGRELKKGSLNPRPYSVRKSEPLPRYIDAAIRDRAQSVPETALTKRFENLEHLITHTRIHGELLARYNPVYGKSNADRIKATAHRVGWDVPIEYQDTVKEQLDAQSRRIDEKYRS